MSIEFEFTATPQLANKALCYLLWRRGGLVGPIAIILFPVVLAVAAADPRIRPVAYIASGAAIMLFVLFLLAVAHRRRIRRRFFKSTSNYTVKVAIDDGGMAVNTAAGSSALPWIAINRIWAGKRSHPGVLPWLALRRLPRSRCSSKRGRVHHVENKRWP